MNFEIAPKDTEIQANWYDAKRYCEELVVDGKGWRLPTRDELDEIYKSYNDFEKWYYWSSTEINIDHVWGQFFTSGSQNTYGKKGGSGFVRAVRTIK